MVETGAFWARLFRPFFFLRSRKRVFFKSSVLGNLAAPSPPSRYKYSILDGHSFLLPSIYLPPLSPTPQNFKRAPSPPTSPQNFGYKSRRFELGSSSFSPGLQNRDRLIQKTNYFLFPRKRRRKLNYFFFVARNWRDVATMTKKVILIL